MRLDLGRPAVMAIVNVTPDSFFADSRTPDGEALRRRIRQVAAEGADVIDVGGYSSRPGADDVSPEEELRRVSLALAIIREELPDMPVSIDTFRVSVAEGAMARYGTCIVNDIAAGELDPQIMAVAARYGAPYIAMHMRGTPTDMQYRERARSCPSVRTSRCWTRRLPSRSTVRWRSAGRRCGAGRAFCGSTTWHRPFRK